MKNTVFSQYKKILSILLCTCLLTGLAGCGPAENAQGNTPQTAQPDATAEPAATGHSLSGENGDASDGANTDPAATTDTDAAPAGKITDGGLPIVDFDHFVNGAWKQEMADQNAGDIYTWDEENREAKEFVMEFLKNGDLSTLSEEDGLYKTAAVFREMLDISDVSARTEKAKELLKPITKAKSLSDLYALYGDERIATFNKLLRFEVKPDWNGYNTLNYCPTDLDGILRYYQEALANEAHPERACYVSYMESLGFSEERATEIVAHALEISDIVNAYQNDPEYVDELWYFDREDMAECPDFPLFDILTKLHAFCGDEDILAHNNFRALCNELFTKEHVEALRDHLLFCGASGMAVVCAYEPYITNENYPYEEYVYSYIESMAGSAPDEYYLREKTSDADMAAIRSIYDDVLAETRLMLGDTEWLTVHMQEKAKSKILGIRTFFGENTYKNEFSDVTLTGDAFDDSFALWSSRDRFERSQTAYEDADRGYFKENMLIGSAWYNERYNAIYISAVCLATATDAENASYEELLGNFGQVLAHEIAHSLDPMGVQYDKDGWLEPWLDEAAQAEYDSRVGQITSFFDGMDTEYDRPVDGALITNETFADIVSMEVCMRLLAKRENPDYDTFFRAVARQDRTYVINNVDYLFSDSHLPSKQRINYVLGQFDEFYDTYDIDKESPYFVQTKDRLRIFNTAPAAPGS
ncbi:MAG: hypothetical protein K5891_00205 [Lachnospiraceae bacterium]|nr:hypothetical protein [Lachnospiraceae bacterium]